MIKKISWNLQSVWCELESSTKYKGSGNQEGKLYRHVRQFSVMDSRGAGGSAFRCWSRGHRFASRAMKVNDKFRLTQIDDTFNMLSTFTFFKIYFLFSSPVNFRPVAIPTTTVKTPKLKKLSIKKVEAMRKALPKELQFPTATEVPKIRNEVKIQARKVDSHNSEKKNLLEKKRKDLAIARKMHKLKISKILSEDHSEKMKKNERRVELCGSRSYCSGNNLRSSSNKENLILEFKRKWRNQRNLRNRKVLRRSKRSLARLVVDSVSKSDSHGFFVKNMDRMPSLKTKENKTPVERITKLLRTFFSNQTEA